jgi:hypothetical protein
MPPISISGSITWSLTPPTLSLFFFFLKKIHPNGVLEGVAERVVEELEDGVGVGVGVGEVEVVCENVWLRDGVEEGDGLEEGVPVSVADDERVGVEAERPSEGQPCESVKNVT